MNLSSRRSARLALLAAAATVALSAASPASAATGTGAVTASLTSPVAVSGVGTQVPMTCTANARAKTYLVRLDPTVVGEYTVAGSATVRGYVGPGSYPATFTMTVTGNGKAYGGVQKGATVTINLTGGAVRFSKTASGSTAPRATGKTVGGQIDWTCPTI